METNQLSIDGESSHNCNSAPDSDESQPYQYFLFYKVKGWFLIVRALTLDEAVKDSTGELELFKGVYADMKSADKAGTELLQVDFPQVEDHY
jgi:hypothetical protein